MLVIFLHDIKGGGRKNDVKNVSDGYARNFLIPKGLARIADIQSVKELEIKKSVSAKNAEAVRDRLEEFGEKLKARRMIFFVNVGRKGEVFGSVTAKDIEEKIEELALNKKDLDDIEVVLERPIETLGEHAISVHLGHGVSGTVTAVIQPAV